MNASASTPTNPTAHTPQEWFRPSRKRSAPALAQEQRPHRMLGFSSIRDLARTSRRPLAETSANVPTRTLRPSNSLYGTLRNQCTPPPFSTAGFRVPVELDSHRSQSSSTDSSMPDLSGISKDSSHSTTPSIGKHLAIDPGKTRTPPRPRSMGNQASLVAKKPLSIKKRFSLAKLKKEHEEKPTPVQKQSLEKLPSMKTLSRKGSSLTIQVPRRRSSLTVLHLDNSHFGSLDPPQPLLHNKASNLTEPGARRSSMITDTARPLSSNADTLRPIASNTTILNPTLAAKKHEQTLSPPLLSPNSRFSFASSQTPSDNSASRNPRNSVMTTHIHLPKTFPEGPVPVHAPALAIINYECFLGHRRMLESRNLLCPVPCMACENVIEPRHWKCDFCGLRICDPCMAEFYLRKRDLRSLLEWVREKKQEQRVELDTAEMEAGDGQQSQTEDMERKMEEQAKKKVETARKRETR